MTFQEYRFRPLGGASRALVYKAHIPVSEDHHRLINTHNFDNGTVIMLFYRWQFCILNILFYFIAVIRTQCRPKGPICAIITLHALLSVQRSTQYYVCMMGRLGTTNSLDINLNYHASCVIFQ